MNVIETKLPGVLIIEPKVFRDSRGFFKETFQTNFYQDAGINFNFVQDNYSRSKRGVLRGLHFQVTKPQGKLVSCFKGAVFDVIVDINPSSPTFSQHVGIVLTENNHYQIFIPPGYAHGFCVLTDIAEFYYKCTDFYDSSDESGLIWNDPDLAIDWPVELPVLSDKDMELPTLKKIIGEL